MADFVIYQTDERMYLLREELAGINPECRTHVFAPNVLLCAKQAEGLQPGEVVIGGKADEEALALFNSLNVTYYNVLENEAFQAVNARLTAEGTIHAILSHSLLAFGDLSALVIGFGRTGAAVARALRQVEVNSLTIASNGSQRPAGAFADKVIQTSRFDFTPYDVVINTVPKKLIEDKEVLTFKPSVIYIDLASVTGLTMCFAKYLGLDADVYPALPAKTAPRSAARAIADYVKEVIV